MAIATQGSYNGFNFVVDLGLGESGFAAVSLPESFVDVVEYRNGNDKDLAARKMPGRPHYTNCVVSRGVSGSLDLYQWWDEVRNGNVTTRRTVVIQLLAPDRSAPVFVWRLLRAWPVRYFFSPLDASGAGPLLESLELACERVEVEGA